MTRDDIVREARSWINTPWRHEGRDRHGIDCAGLLVMLARAFNLSHDDIRGYARQPTGTGFLEHLRRHLDPAPLDGDLTGLVGIFSQKKFPCHTGIFSYLHGQPHLINARADRPRAQSARHRALRVELQGCVVEERFIDGCDGLNLIGVGRLPGMSD
jgi:hypothetical protein